MRAPLRLTGLFAAWVLGTLSLLPEAGLDLHVILWLIGLLVLRELAGRGLDDVRRARVDGTILAGLLAFSVVVVLRVREILLG